MEVISSFLDNLKQKLTNPLFGTLIFVWCIRNFNFLFSLFNFDAGTLLSEKIDYISKYYDHKNLGIEFLTNIFYALILLIIGYVFVIISRIIMNMVYHRMIPWLNKKLVDEKAFTIDKGRFDIVKKQRDDSFEKILELNEIIVGLEQNNAEYKSKNIELNSQLTNLSQASIETRIEFEKEKKVTINLSDNIKKLENKVKDLEGMNEMKKNDSLYWENKYNTLLSQHNQNNKYLNDEVLLNIILPKYHLLIENKLLEYFLNFCRFIMTADSDGANIILDSKKNKILEDLGLIFQNSHTQSKIDYRLTEGGLFIYENNESLSLF